jgi:hypothetical protein
MQPILAWEAPGLIFTMWLQLFLGHELCQMLQSWLVSFEHPTGEITNSNQKLGGSMVHINVLVHHHNLVKTTIAMLGDNQATVN